MIYADLRCAGSCIPYNTLIAFELIISSDFDGDYYGTVIDLT